MRFTSYFAVMFALANFDTVLGFQWSLYHTLTAHLEVGDGSQILVRLVGATVSGAKALSDVIYH